MAGIKTSVLLDEDLHKAWKESGLSMQEVIRRGLQGYPPAAGGSSSMVSAYGTGGMAVASAPGGAGGHASTPPPQWQELRESVAQAAANMDKLIALLRDQGYVIVPREELRQMIEVMIREACRPGVTVQQDDDREMRQRIARDLEERYGSDG